MSRMPGPRMIAALHYVRAHPGVTKHEVAIAVGPNGSNRYGDAIVLRCIRRGLLEDRADRTEHPWAAYEMHLTEAGQQILKEV